MSRCHVMMSYDLQRKIIDSREYSMKVIVNVESQEVQAVLVCSQVILQRCTSEKDLVKDAEKQTVYSIVFGLPTEATIEELNSIFEPLLSEIEEITFLSETTTRDLHANLPEILNSFHDEDLSRHGSYVLTQKKIFAIVKFCNDVKRSLFNALYHNMPLNSFRDCPPCMVANVSQIEFICDNQSILPELQRQFPQCEFNSITKGYSDLLSIIPSCTLCVRRLKSMKQLLSLGAALADQEIAVGRSFHTESLVSVTEKANVLVRCIVCFIYHYYQTKSSTNSGQTASFRATDQGSAIGCCLDCGLVENIWACLVCGYTGCGRYTQKHAEAHSLVSHHAYSLELATGRIWEYSADEFVHFDDSSSIYNGLLQQCTSFQFESSRVGFAETVPVTREQSMNKLLVSHRFLEDQDHQVLQAMGEEKIDKLNSLTAEYERMIELQLRDQQLYYDKLLARETVRAMEYSFNLQRGKHQDSQNGFQKLPALSEHSIVKDEVFTDDGLVDQELEAIEHLKMDISSIEIEYKLLFDQLKEVEEKCRIQKKQNDSLLKEQRQLKLKETEYLSKEEELRRRCSEQIQELEQQIVDLNFFIKTKKQMDASPYKDEIAQGVIITADDPSRSTGKKSSSKSRKKN